jgi:hypothetical protein
LLQRRNGRLQERLHGESARSIEDCTGYVSRKLLSDSVERRLHTLFVRDVSEKRDGMSARLLDAVFDRLEIFLVTGKQSYRISSARELPS